RGVPLPRHASYDLPLHRDRVRTFRGPRHDGGRAPRDRVESRLPRHLCAGVGAERPRVVAESRRPRALRRAARDRAVLFMGRLSAPKGIYDLFDAMAPVLANHPDVRFVLAGVAETEAQEPLL